MFLKHFACYLGGRQCSWRFTKKNMPAGLAFSLFSFSFSTICFKVVGSGGFHTPLFLSCTRGGGPQKWPSAVGCPTVPCISPYSPPHTLTPGTALGVLFSLSGGGRQPEPKYQNPFPCNTMNELSKVSHVSTPLSHPTVATHISPHTSPFTHSTVRHCWLFGGGETCFFEKEHQKPHQKKAKFN